MAYFVEIPRAAIDSGAWDLAVKAARWGTAELELPHQPAVRWFREGLKSYDLDGFEHDTRRPAGLMGTALHDPRTVWLRDGMSRAEQLITVLHELRHLQQGPDLTGKSAEREERNEAEAERWGRQAAAEFESRPRGIKSLDLVVPTVSLTKSEHVFGHDDVPGLKAATRFGAELYGPTRPLVMGDGMGSLTAKRLGTVTNIGVDDDEERVWFTAQLGKNEQYRRWIARLIEQGAFQARALVVDHHIARDDRGRVSELPVAAIALRPQAIHA